ncbi:MAG: UDP-N-acetylglucosamine 2-epimerase (non-hydrolyzing) [Firmicutes bacterium]|nr:UDP-N-acetylglucosamine 2-epimerase (non-hydrolyzing) [Candidatus Fermentithermobacillaceae bacterium]
MSVFGTRPEAIKMAPVIKALEAAPEIESRVTVTAQHREMLDQVLDCFSIKVDYDLDIMDYNQSLAQVTVRVLERLTPVLQKERPHILLVHGDTATTAASALAAYYLKIPCGHVEAGLRTYDKYAPFPEEIMRKIADDISDLRFAPTLRAKENLLKEGFPEETIFVTGNTAVDALLMTVRDNHTFKDARLREVLSRSGPALDRASYACSSSDDEGGRGIKDILVEVHRRENFGAGMEEIGRALRWIAENREDVRLLVSVHPNPNVREPITRWLKDAPRVVMFEPLDYPDYVNLMARCYLVISDSGGVQEEAPSVRVPVVLCREKTERPEAVEAGVVVLVGTKFSAITSMVSRLLGGGPDYEAMRSGKNPFGDGLASRRIVDAILYRYNVSRVRPHEFGEEGDGGVRIH